VPPNGNERPTIEGGTLWGLGSADMKGGLAVMLDLALTVPEPAHDLTFVFYVAEEIAREHSGLLAIATQGPELLDDIDAAIVCEPTSSIVEAGCQGVLKAEVVMDGERAHVARPWTGRNALHRLAPVIDAIAHWPARKVDVDGCTYTESLQAVAASAGVTWNVVPDRASVRVNYRFAPDLAVGTASDALGQFLAPYLGPGDTFIVLDSSPAAPPSLGHPVLAQLVASADGLVKAKLGWTDVAFFAERGVPAANFGPGDPEVAHKADEMVTRASLELARSVLGRLLSA
jgi:succinyl-diaminopimelate desuccinylase